MDRVFLVVSELGGGSGVKVFDRLSSICSFIWRCHIIESCSKRRPMERNANIFPYLCNKKNQISTGLCKQLAILHLLERTSKMQYFHESKGTVRSMAIY